MLGSMGQLLSVNPTTAREVLQSFRRARRRGIRKVARNSHAVFIDEFHPSHRNVWLLAQTPAIQYWKYEPDKPFAASCPKATAFF
jgi:hypothetical protein